MYPGPNDPDLGVFVANLERELVARGHEIERAVVDTRSGGTRRHVALFRDARRTARQLPSRMSSTRTSSSLPASRPRSRRARRSSSPRTGRTSRTSARPRASARATRHVVRRAATVIAVSRWLRDRLERGRARAQRQDRGGRLRRRPRALRAARRRGCSRRGRLDWRRDGVPLPRRASERKNVLRLARAFEQRGEGTLTFVGDGPLRGALEGRPGIRLVGRVGHDDGARPGSPPPTSSASRASSEPFGLATLEAMASARSVVATTVGGPPEFVTPRVGRARRPARRRRARRRRSRTPPRSRARTSPAATRPAITTSSCRRSGWRRSSCEPFEIGEPDLDERPDRRPRGPASRATASASS